MTSRTFPTAAAARRRLAGIGLWLLCCCLALASIWIVERRAQIAELTRESERLHALVSQRVHQHDAHLTALSAIASADADRHPSLFGEVAEAILRFYPRITRILLVPLDGKAGTLDIGPQEPDLREIVRRAANRPARVPVLVRHSSEWPEYLIIKRSPNTDAARYGLALVIDAAALLDGESDYWDRTASARALAMPEGTAILADNASSAAPHFSRQLSSDTQPLLLETAVTLNTANLLPPRQVALALLVITLSAVGGRMALHQRVRVRAAERRAELSGIETRLSHASRVNALGEMASGMAHELTQPLTAILARAQAARHLAQRGETERVGAILEEVVGQTRRAAAILERLRTWTRPQERRTESIDLGECVRVVETLLARQAEEAGAKLEIRVPRSKVPVLADRVELEQVLFNLVKNALDAVAGTDGAREVTIALTSDRGRAQIDVADSGPGIRDDIRGRLFTPFLTTKEDGTGLGLVLSHRLVERAGGDLVSIDRPHGAHFRFVLPLAKAAQEAAE